MNYRDFLEQRGIDTFDGAGSSDFLINCPFHDDNHPSLEVHNSKGVFYCFGCKESGSFASLLAEIENIPFLQAKKLLLSLDSADNMISELEDLLQNIDDEIDEQLKFYSIKSFHNKYRKLAVSKSGMDYVLNRNITRASIERFDLRWGGLDPKWSGRVLIPIYTESKKLLTFAGRTIKKNIQPKTKKVKGRSPRKYLYGLDTILENSKDSKKFPYMIVVEGEFDAMYLQQFGLNAVSTMGTMGMTGEQIFLLKKYSEIVVMSYDGDEAGRKAQERANIKLKQFVPVVNVKLPDGFDPNELSKAQVKKFYKEFYYDD